MNSTREPMPLGQTLQRAVPIVSSVTEILTQIKLSHYADIFEIHCVHTYSDLKRLTEAQMKEMGIWKVGERNRLIHWIGQSLRTRNLTDESDSRPAPLRRGAVSMEDEYAVPRTAREMTVTVSGAGIKEVNGNYEVSGERDGVPKYRKSTFWKGSQVDVVLFRCRLADGTRPWFISIVPINQVPGTHLDIDFYKSVLPHQDSTADVPPERGWSVCQDGVAPAPTVEVGRAQRLASGASISHRTLPAVQYDTSSSFVTARASFAHPKEAMVGVKIMIENAGTMIVNGIYTPAVGEDGFAVYTKGIYWEGRRQSILVFRCNDLDKPTRWFISCVPFGVMSGENRIVDYYDAPVTTDKTDLPPQHGWTQAEGGVYPPPNLVFLTLNPSEEYEHRHDSYDRSSTSSRSLSSNLHSHQFSVGCSTSTAPVRPSQATQHRSTRAMHSIDTNETSLSTSKAGCLDRKSLRVQGASLSFIDGVYVACGKFDSVAKFQKEVIYKGCNRTLTLFRCRVQGNKRRWYISIVPSRCAPGTKHDTDFYTAPAKSLYDAIPPRSGWVAVGEGRGQPPCVFFGGGDNKSTADDNSEEELQLTTEVTFDDGVENSSEDEPVQELTPRTKSGRKLSRWNPMKILSNRDSQSRQSKLVTDINTLEVLTAIP